ERGPVLDERVQVLEAEDAGREHGRAREGALDESAALALGGDERLDHGHAGRRADGLEDRRLAVPRRAGEEEPAAVREPVAAVELLRREELGHGARDVLGEAVREEHVLPGDLLAARAALAALAG